MQGSQKLRSALIHLVISHTWHTSQFLWFTARICEHSLFLLFSIGGYFVRVWSCVTWWLERWRSVKCRKGRHQKKKKTEEKRNFHPSKLKAETEERAKEKKKKTHIPSGSIIKTGDNKYIMFFFFFSPSVAASPSWRWDHRETGPGSGLSTLAIKNGCKEHQSWLAPSTNHPECCDVSCRGYRAPKWSLVVRVNQIRHLSASATASAHLRLAAAGGTTTQWCHWGRKSGPAVCECAVWRYVCVH